MAPEEESYNDRQKMLIEAQDKIIEGLIKRLHILSVENLRLKQHMKVLVLHPVGLAAKIISEKYSPGKITKELQTGSRN